MQNPTNPKITREEVRQALYKFIIETLQPRSPVPIDYAGRLAIIPALVDHLDIKSDPRFGKE